MRRIKSFSYEHDDLLHFETRRYASLLSEGNSKSDQDNLDRMFDYLQAHLSVPAGERIAHSQKNDDLNRLFYLSGAASHGSPPSSTKLREALEETVIEHQSNSPAAWETCNAQWMVDGTVVLKFECGRYQTRSGISPVVSRSGIFGALFDVYDRKLKSDVLGIELYRLFADYTSKRINDVGEFRYRVDLELTRLFFVSDALRRSPTT